jgi:catechol-2,3-dioxygenase
MLNDDDNVEMIKRANNHPYMQILLNHHHLALNQWISGTKRVDNAHSYGLALVDFHYQETTHLNIKGPDGIYFRFNFIKEE